MIEKKPLVSFIIFSYNQEKFIHEAVVSALEQKYEPLEILIYDDHSTDNSISIIKNCVYEYQGPHKVTINRNQENVGLAESINRSWEMTNGDLIVVQGGDDVSLPGRVEELVDRWVSTNPRPDIVFSNVFFMNALGEITGTQTQSCYVPTLEEVAKGKRFIAGGMAAAYSRHLAGSSRPLDPRVLYEDYVLTFRALVGNGVAHVAKPLVKYRKHDKSIMASAEWGLNNRVLAQQRSRHVPVEIEDVLQSWLRTGHSMTLFTWKLRRKLAKVKLDALSCQASPVLALLYSLWALISFRPRMALTLLLRDVLCR